MIHTEREITAYTDGFSWTCADCGTEDTTRYQKWDDVIFAYATHSLEQRVAALEAKVNRLNAAWATSGIDNYLDATTAPEGTAPRG